MDDAHPVSCPVNLCRRTFNGKSGKYNRTHHINREHTCQERHAISEATLSDLGKNRCGHPNCGRLDSSKGGPRHECIAQTSGAAVLPGAVASPEQAQNIRGRSTALMRNRRTASAAPTNPSRPNSLPTTAPQPASAAGGIAAASAIGQPSSVAGATTASDESTAIANNNQPAAAAAAGAKTHSLREAAAALAEIAETIVGEINKFKRDGSGRECIAVDNLRKFQRMIVQGVRKVSTSTATAAGIDAIDEHAEPDAIADLCDRVIRAQAVLPRSTSKAVDILTRESKPVNLADPAVQAAVRALYPHPERADAQPGRVMPPLSAAGKEAIMGSTMSPFLHEEVAKYLTDHKGKSPGLSGITYDALAAIFSAATTAQRDSTCKLLLYLADGGMPNTWTQVHATLTTARGIALSKSATNKTKVRPISIMDVLVQTAHGVLAKRMVPLVKKYVDNNFAVGIPDGCAAYAHCLTAMASTKLHWLFLKLDIVNAYNRMPREELLKQFEALITSGDDDATQLAPLVRTYVYLYGRESTTVYNSEFTVTVCDGVMQGHAIATILFCIWLASILKKLRLRHPGLHILALADDTTIAADPKVVIAAYDDFSAMLGEQRNELAKDKTGMYRGDGYSDPDIQAFAAANGITLAEANSADDGFEAAGVPVGSRAYKERLTTDTVDGVIHVIKLMAELLDHSVLMSKTASTQQLLQMLKKCVLTIPTHLWRSIPPSITAPHAERLDVAVQGFVNKLLDISVPPNEKERVAVQMALPLASGGLGITNTASLVALAYLSSWHGSIGWLGLVAPDVLIALPAATLAASPGVPSPCASVLDPEVEAAVAVHDAPAAAEAAAAAGIAPEATASPGTDGPAGAPVELLSSPASGGAPLPMISFTPPSSHPSARLLLEPYSSPAESTTPAGMALSPDSQRYNSQGETRSTWYAAHPYGATDDSDPLMERAPLAQDQVRRGRDSLGDSITFRHGAVTRPRSGWADGTESDRLGRGIAHAPRRPRGQRGRAPVHESPDLQEIDIDRINIESGDRAAAAEATATANAVSAGPPQAAARHPVHGLDSQLGFNESDINNPDNNVVPSAPPASQPVASHLTHQLPNVVDRDAIDALERYREQLRRTGGLDISDNPATTEIVNDLRIIEKALDPKQWQAPGAPAHRQRKLTAVLNKAQAHRYTQLLNTKGAREQHAHQCSPDAAAWLDSPGTCFSGTAMSNTEFITAVHSWLGIIATPGGHCGECSKNHLVPHDASHAFTCRVTRPARSECHHAVKFVLLREAKSILNTGTSKIIHVDKEAPVLNLAPRAPGAPQPDVLHTYDLCVQTADKKTYIVDVTSAHPSDNKIIGGVNIKDLDYPAEGPDHFLTERDKAKQDKYGKNYEIKQNINLVVVPFTFATYGLLSKPARDFIGILAKLRSSSGYRQRGLPLPYSCARRQLAQRLSVTVQAYHARMIRSYCLGHLRRDAPVGPA